MSMAEDILPHGLVPRPGAERLAAQRRAQRSGESAEDAGSAVCSLDTSRDDATKNTSQEEQNQATGDPRQRRQQKCPENAGSALYRWADIPDQRNRGRQLKDADHDRNGTGASEENHCQSPVIHSPTPFLTAVSWCHSRAGTSSRGTRSAMERPFLGIRLMSPFFSRVKII